MEVTTFFNKVPTVRIRRGEEEELDFEIGALEGVGILEVSALWLFGRRCISWRKNKTRAMQGEVICYWENRKMFLKGRKKQGYRRRWWTPQELKLLTIFTHWKNLKKDKKE